MTQLTKKENPYDAILEASRKRMDKGLEKLKEEIALIGKKPQKEEQNPNCETPQEKRIRERRGGKWEKHPTKPNTFIHTKTLEEWEHISVWKLPELLSGEPPYKPRPKTDRECYHNYFQEFRETPVACMVVMLLVILSFFVFMALPAFIYFGGQYAYHIYGINGLLDQFMWYAYKPLALVGAFIFFFKWEHWIWANFSPAMIGGKEEYQYLFPRISRLLDIPVPQGQLHKGR